MCQNLKIQKTQKLIAMIWIIPFKIAIGNWMIKQKIDGVLVFRKSSY